MNLGKPENMKGFIRLSIGVDQSLRELSKCLYDKALSRLSKCGFRGGPMAFSSLRSATVIVLFLALFGLVSAEWTAFNDCIRTTGGDFTAANVTDWTIYNNYTNHNFGLLKDFQSGANLPVTVTFTMLNGLATSS
jgi:hypothetical protein